MEFDLIARITALCGQSNSDVLLGIGDDAAVLAPEPGQRLVVSTDTLNSGVHFLPDDPANTIGHKALAVNLSDLAAMGATPKWVMLNLSLPTVDLEWIDAFISGFNHLAQTHQVQLVGGDTTQGPLSITVTAMGTCHDWISRAGAHADELIVVSGQLGSAAFALNNPGKDPACTQALQKPMPRLDLLAQIKPVATAMIDVSDGLLADLGHVCTASGVGAILDLELLPHKPVIEQDSNWPQHVLAGGDDYQLCFTIPREHMSQLPADCTVIGHTTIETGIALRQDGQPIDFEPRGYQHFDHES